MKLKILSKLLAAACLLTGAARAQDIDVFGGDPTTVTIRDGDFDPQESNGTDFGSVTAGSGSKTTRFRIFNDPAMSNGNDLVISNIEITNQSGSAFGVTFPLLIPGVNVIRIDSGDSEDFLVRFAPSNNGIKNVTVKITTNETGSEKFYTFNLTGKGVGNPEIKVEGKPLTGLQFLNISDSDSSPRTSDGTEFPDTCQGRVSLSNFLITNSGNDQLDIDSITSSSSQFVVAGVPSSVSTTSSGKSFQVTFEPTSSGTKTGTITIQNNDTNEDPFTFSVKGFAEAADIDVFGGTDFTKHISDGDITPRESDGTDFGNRAVTAGSISNTFRVVNDGNKNLILSGGVGIINQAGSSFSLAPNHLGANIGPGGHRDFTVTFNPEAGGLKNVTVQIISNDPTESPYTFDLTGVGDGNPEIKVEGRAFNAFTSPFQNIPNGVAPLTLTSNGTKFSATNVGSSALTSLVIRNTGTSRLNITDDITFSGAAADFSVTQIDQIPAGGSKALEIVFTPTKTRGRIATVTIPNDDADESPFVFEISGFGLAPEMRVTGMGNFIGDGDETPRPEDGTDFGEVNVNGGTQSSIFQIENIGNNNLILDNIAANGTHFTISDYNLPVIIPGQLKILRPDETTTFTVTFNPVSSGGKTRDIVIGSNDPDSPNFTFKIQGNTVAGGGGATVNPEIEVNGRNGSGAAPQNIADGASTTMAGNGTSLPPAIIGDSVKRNFIIKNIGDAALAINGVLLKGNNPLQFRIGDTPTTVAAGDSEVMEIFFEPTKENENTAVVEILNDDSNENPFTFTISANATGAPQPEIAISSASATRGGTIASGSTSGLLIPLGRSFPDTEVGNFSSKTFTVENLGEADLTIDDIIFSDPAFSVTNTSTTVAPGATKDLTIKFSPTTEGEVVAIVEIANNDANENPFTFSIVGEGVVTDAGGPTTIPELRLGGKSLPQANFLEITDGEMMTTADQGTDFGTIEAGGVVEHFFIIRNTGSAPLEVINSDSSQAEFSLGMIPSSIDPGDDAMFSIIFAPTGAGVFESTIQIKNNDPDEEKTDFKVTGIATEGAGAPEIEVRGGNQFTVTIPDGDTTPRLADGTGYRDVVAGEALTRSFGIMNTGTGPLTISQIEIQPAASNFTVMSGPSGDIAPGRNATFVVEYLPMAVGEETVTVEIMNNDSDEALYNFDLRGSAIEATSASGPEIAVGFQSGGMVASIQSGATNASPMNGTDYGETEEQMTPLVRTFRLRNTGDAPLEFNGAAVDSAAFEIRGIPASLAPGESGSFRVGFYPVSVGISTGMVTIRNNDSNESEFTFVVEAVVTAPEPEPFTRLIFDARPTVDGNDLLGRLRGMAGTSYRLKTSTDLFSWDNVPGRAPIVADGTIQNFILPMAGPNAAPGPKRFYRIEAE